MSDYGQQEPNGQQQPQQPAPPPPPQQPYAYPSAPPVAGQYAQPGYGMQFGPLGQPRRIGISILLAIVTLGIYAFVWTFKTGREIKQHSGVGFGAATFAFMFIPYVGSIVTMILVGNDTKDMLALSGRESRVSAKTTWWVLLPIAGSIVWFVKVQGQLNEYWESLGAQA